MYAKFTIVFEEVKTKSPWANWVQVQKSKCSDGSAGRVSKNTGGIVFGVEPVAEVLTGFNCSDKASNQETDGPSIDKRAVNITVQLDLEEFRYDKRAFDFRVVSFGERLRDYRCKKLKQFHNQRFVTESGDTQSSDYAGQAFAAGAPHIDDVANLGCVYDDVLPNMYDPDGEDGVIDGVGGSRVRTGIEIIDMS
jgi:hypothetical protein